MNTDKSMFEFYTEIESVLSELHMNREIDASLRPGYSGTGNKKFQQELLRKVIDFDIKLSELCKRK